MGFASDTLAKTLSSFVDVKIEQRSGRIQVSVRPVHAPRDLLAASALGQYEVISMILQKHPKWVRNLVLLSF